MKEEPRETMGSTARGALTMPAIGPSRIASLDGLRAVSILLVVLCHVAETGHSPIPAGAWWYARQAAVGVDVFFVISGFLITTLLLRERDKNGSISLGGFYARRAVRILPAFGAYLGVMAALDYLGWLHLGIRDWIAAATYTVNFTPGVAHPLWHIWSLSVEEHFYLLWPLALVMLGAVGAGRVALIVLLAEPVVRWITYQYARDFIDIDFATFTRLDAIAVGCLLAMSARAPEGRSIMRFVDASPALWFGVGVGMLLLSVCVLGRSGKYAIVARPFINALSIGLIVWTATRFPATRFGRVLNWSPLAWLGRLSYSLYIWQQVFLDRTSEARWFCQFPQNLVLSLGAAVVSYYLIERPFLSLKGKWKRPAQLAPGSRTRNEPPGVAAQPT